MRNLAITATMDPQGCNQWRCCGKLWASSLLRHQWGGLIHISRNFPQPMFPVERMDLREIEPGKGFMPVTNTPEAWKTASRKHQVEMARIAAVQEEFDWILFADADCIAMRNLDHLFTGNCDLLISSPRKVPDPGFFAVRGSHVQDLLDQLEASGGLSSPALASAMDSGRWRVREFERGEVLRPGDPDVSTPELAEAAVVHFSGLKPELKQRLAFAFHMMAVYGDHGGLFFDIMEA